MLDEQTRARAYATIHAALRGRAAEVVTTQEFLETIKKLRKELEEKAQQKAS